MKGPKISVIVPVYNAEKWLHQCVDSILAQRFSDFELLLIDDGSTDGSGIICDEYSQKDSRVRVFHKKNGGVSSARNLGLDNARGEWIAFCDADDSSYPCWLDNFMQHADGGYDMIIQGFETTCPWEQNKMYHGIRYEGDPGAGLIKLSQNYYMGYLWCKLFKANIIQEYNLRFNCDMFLQEDDDFVMSYAMHCNHILSTDSIGYLYSPPNFEDKYQKYDCFALRENLLRKSMELYKGKCNSLVDRYIDCYTEALVDIYKFQKNISSKNIRQYRETAGKLLLRSRLSAITRWIIYLDRTGIISSWWLTQHLRLRIIMGKY